MTAKTKLADRVLPTYSRGEETFNMVSHIVGGGIGVLIFVLCVAFSAIKGNPWAFVSSAVYGISMIMLYTVSSVYHRLRHPTAKKVMQVLDHCVIYFLIAGTYTPILLCSIRIVSPFWAWTLFAVVWGFAALATVFTAIDLRKYRVLSMICYIGMGWCIVFAAKAAIEAIPAPGLLWLLAGGVSYTVGAVLYGLGRSHTYMHCVFHLFVVLGSVLQFICIFFYVI